MLIANNTKTSSNILFARPFRHPRFQKGKEGVVTFPVSWARDFSFSISSESNLGRFPLGSPIFLKIARHATLVFYCRVLTPRPLINRRIEKKLHFVIASSTINVINYVLGRYRSKNNRYFCRVSVESSRKVASSGVSAAFVEFVESWSPCYVLVRYLLGNSICIRIS